MQIDHIYILVFFWEIIFHLTQFKYVIQSDFF